MGRNSYSMWFKFSDILYEIPVNVLNELETKSDIIGYHAYVESWKPIIGGKLQNCPEPENIMGENNLLYNGLKQSSISF